MSATVLSSYLIRSCSVPYVWWPVTYTGENVKEEIENNINHVINHLSVTVVMSRKQSSTGLVLCICV